MPPISTSTTLGTGETGTGRRALGIVPVASKAKKVVKPKVKAPVAKAKAKPKASTKKK